MKVFLVGGGTGGPTAPLIGVAEELSEIKKDTEFIFIGHGDIEKKLIENLPFPVHYHTIPAGKWRRYFSLKNFLDVFKIIAGFIKSIFLIRKYRPDLVFGAGSFVQVPLCYAAYLFKVPIVIHQQDVSWLLSTKLVAPLARAITVGFAASSKELPQFSGFFKKIQKKSKVVVTGNPVRKEIKAGSVKEAREIFNLNKNFPTVLVVGGGTGAEKLNQAVLEALPELVKYVQIIHSTGGKVKKTGQSGHDHYHAFDFLGPELAHAYAVADLVISRAGMATISELSALGKPSIIVPLPESPQEDNAVALAYFKAAVVVFEEYLTGDLLVRLVRKILWNKDTQETLSKNIKGATAKDAGISIAKLLLKIYNEDQKSHGKPQA